MPMNMLKYIISLFCMVVIAYFCARFITAKLKKAGILKGIKKEEKKPEETPAQEELKEENDLL
ncbi:hypothetical protein LCGC14_1678520 [marine sediment metagenome]|uniref:Uncharacterized protein n=1 Tax=marine sediment metagenome TaxID=412755 RepID=A0A0F9K509_9ZZZZ